MQTESRLQKIIQSKDDLEWSAPKRGPPVNTGTEFNACNKREPNIFVSIFLYTTHCTVTIFYSWKRKLH